MWKLIHKNLNLVSQFNRRPDVIELLNNRPEMIRLLNDKPYAIELFNNQEMVELINKNSDMVKLLDNNPDMIKRIIKIGPDTKIRSEFTEKSLHNRKSLINNDAISNAPDNGAIRRREHGNKDVSSKLQHNHNLPIKNGTNTNALISINQAILQKAYNDKESDDNKQDIKKLLASIGTDFKDLEELEKELSFSMLKELDITKSSNSASIEALNNFNQTLIFNQTLSHDVYFKLLTKIGVGIKAWNFPCLAIVDGADCYNRPDMIEASAAHASDFDIPNNSSENEMVSVINYDLPNDKSDIHIQLHKACLDGDLNKAKIILNQGVNVDVVDHEHMTPVYYACLNGHVELAKFLMMTCKANISIRDNSDNTFLHMVCCNGHVGIAELLVKKDAAMVNTRNKSGYTPLYYACLKGDVKIAKLLIKNDAEIDIANQVDETLLLEACRHNQTAIIRLLVKVKKSALVNTCTSRLKTPLHYVCQKGNIKGAKKLLKHGAYVNARDIFNNTSLHYASLSGDPKMVKLLINKGTIINASNHLGDTALHEACRQDHLEIIELLVAKRADTTAVNASGHTPFDILHLELIRKFQSI